MTPSNLTHPVNFPCGRKPEYEVGTLLEIEPGTLEVKSEWSDHYTTEAPCGLTTEAPKSLVKREIFIREWGKTRV